MRRHAHILPASGGWPESHQSMMASSEFAPAWRCPSLPPWGVDRYHVGGPTTPARSRERTGILRDIDGWLRRKLVRLDHPAAAHCLIEVDRLDETIALRLGVLQLSGEEAALGVEHLEIARISRVVAQPGESRIVAQRGYLPPLCAELHANFLAANEGILELLERDQDRPLIRIQRLLLLRLGRSNLPRNAACRENRSRGGTGVGPHPRWATP